ncbi:MAG: DUF2017 family protein [Candidatus Dormibacteria bacterium]|jgi:hypothetical protein
MARVRRRRGRVQLQLDSDERTAIRDIVDELSPLLGHVSRTAPVAYADEEMEREYDHWVRPEIDRGRDADLSVIRDCLDSGEDISPLTEEQTLAWVRGLNHLRLAAGALLGVEQDGWELSPDSALRDKPEFRVLLALGYLQEELIAALES